MSAIEVKKIIPITSVEEGVLYSPALSMQIVGPIATPASSVATMMVEESLLICALVAVVVVTLAHTSRGGPSPTGHLRECARHSSTISWTSTST